MLSHVAYRVLTDYLKWIMFSTFMAQVRVRVKQAGVVDRKREVLPPFLNWAICTRVGCVEDGFRPRWAGTC